jgi:hypothetical protein
MNELDQIEAGWRQPNEWNRVFQIGITVLLTVGTIFVVWS